MKILHLQENYMDNWTYQENILPQKQADLGNEVVIIVSRKYPSYLTKGDYEGPDEYKINSVKVIREHYKNNRFDLTISNLEKRLYDEKPDFIFLHGISMLKSKTLMKYIKNNKPKVVIDVHVDTNNSIPMKKINKLMSYSIYKIYYRMLIRLYLKYISKIFYVAPSSMKFCIDYYGISEKKLFPLYLGCDYKMIDFSKKDVLKMEIRKKYNLSKEAILIIFAGKIDKNKKIELLIDSFHELKIPNVYLLIAGSLNEEYRNYLDSNMLKNDHIKFIGWKNNQDLMDLFLSCDLGVFPGGQSALWQQALCCGLPCVYGYWEGIEYLNAGNAVILKKRTVVELTHILNELLLNKNKLDEMNAIAIEYGNKHFNYLEIAKESIL